MYKQNAQTLLDVIADYFSISKCQLHKQLCIKLKQILLSQQLIPYRLKCINIQQDNQILNDYEKYPDLISFNKITYELIPITYNIKLIIYSLIKTNNKEYLLNSIIINTHNTKDKQIKIAKVNHNYYRVQEQFIEYSNLSYNSYNSTIKSSNLNSEQRQQKQFKKMRQPFKSQKIIVDPNDQDFFNQNNNNEQNGKNKQYPQSSDYLPNHNNDEYKARRSKNVNFKDNIQQKYIDNSNDDIISLDRQQQKQLLNKCSNYAQSSNNISMNNIRGVKHQNNHISSQSLHNNNIIRNNDIMYYYYLQQQHSINNINNNMNNANHNINNMNNNMNNISHNMGHNMNNNMSHNMNNNMSHNMTYNSIYPGKSEPYLTYGSNTNNNNGGYINNTIPTYINNGNPQLYSTTTQLYNSNITYNANLSNNSPTKSQKLINLNSIQNNSPMKYPQMNNMNNSNMTNQHLLTSSLTNIPTNIPLSMIEIKQGQRYNGRLKFFDQAKNYGFIIMDADQSDLFVHYDDLQKAGISKDKIKTYKQIQSGYMQVRFSFKVMEYFGKYRQSRKAVQLVLLSTQQDIANDKQNNNIDQLSLSNNIAEQPNK